MPDVHVAGPKNVGDRDKYLIDQFIMGGGRVIFLVDEINMNEQMGLMASVWEDPQIPADENRPVSLNSRRRRNAVRVYVEEEHRYMGLDTP